MATQALWFSVPVVARQAQWLQGVEPLSTQYAAYAFLWIAAGHSLQYLWVTTYYARASSTWNGYGSYLLRCLLAGSAIWALPALVFAPGLLGALPYDAGLGVLVAATVNLHHFILDGAIWKLRDGRVARILLRAAEDVPGAAEPTRGPWLRRSIWAAGALSLCVLASAPLLEELGFRRALVRGELERAEAAAKRLAWLGRDSASLHVGLALLAAQEGEVERAQAELDRSLALHPTADAWRTRGWIHEREGDSARAIAPYREALRLRPRWAEAANNLAWLLATHENPILRNAAEASSLAEQAAAATQYRDPAVLDTLAAARAAALQFSQAVQIAERAVALAEAADAPAEDLDAMRARLEGYRRGRAWVSTDAELAAGPHRRERQRGPGVRLDRARQLSRRSGDRRACRRRHTPAASARSACWWARSSAPSCWPSAGVTCRAATSSTCSRRLAPSPNAAACPYRRSRTRGPAGMAGSSAPTR
jgi:Tfp pilus assembly protein PilF